MSQGETTASTSPLQPERLTDAGTALHKWVRQGRTFSGYERNCAFLNTHGPRFANVSAVSGLDFADDGRAIAVTDWDHDGDLDLWIVNRSSPQIRFLRNDYPDRHHYLALRLEGRRCNRNAIGARVEVQLDAAGSRTKLIKTVRAGDGYLGQSSLWLHFGLADAQEVARVVVRWPDGMTEEWEALEVDRSYEIVQGEPRARLWQRRTTPVPLESQPLAPIAATDAVQRLLSVPFPLPPLKYQDWDGNTMAIDQADRPRLIVLWASWCPPCWDELRQMADDRQAQRLRDAGLDVIALSVDEVDPREGYQDRTRLRSTWEALKFPFGSGLATVDLVEKLQIVHNLLFDRHRPLPVPVSFLIDTDGRLAAMYKGSVDVERVLLDSQRLSLDLEARRQLAVPFAGRWLGPVAQPRPSALAWELIDHGLLSDAVQYAAQYAHLLTHDDQYAPLLVHLGNELVENGQLDQALARYRAALSVDPTFASAYLNMAVALVKKRDFAGAKQALQQAIGCRPDYAEAHYQLGALWLQTGDLRQADQHLERAVQLRPNERAYRLVLANAQVRQGRLAEGAEHLEVALAVDSRDATAWGMLGSVRNSQNRQADAIACFEKALALRPDSSPAMDQLAWLLATAAEPGQRDAERAVQLAQTACRESNFENAKRLDTLAAAYAAAGRFDDAIATAEQAHRRAEQTNQARLAAGIAQRLKVYQARRPLVP